MCSHWTMPLQHCEYLSAGVLAAWRLSLLTTRWFRLQLLVHRIEGCTARSRIGPRLKIGQRVDHASTKLVKLGSAAVDALLVQGARREIEELCGFLRRQI